MMSKMRALQTSRSPSTLMIQTLQLIHQVQLHEHGFLTLRLSNPRLSPVRRHAVRSGANQAALHALQDGSVQPMPVCWRHQEHLQSTAPTFRWLPIHCAVHQELQHAYANSLPLRCITHRHRVTHLVSKGLVCPGNPQRRGGQPPDGCCNSCQPSQQP